MERQTELKAQIFDIIAGIETKQAEINDLHQKRLEALRELAELQEQSLLGIPDTLPELAV